MAEQEKSEKNEKAGIRVKKSTLSIIVVGVVALAVGVILGSAFNLTGAVCAPSGETVEKTVAGQKAVDYINDNLVSQGTTASLVSVEEFGNLYRVITSYQGSEIPLFVDKAGNLMFVSSPYLINETPAQEAETPTSVPKNDKPVVELFVMSHCPYGTQAEKGILPAVRTLGDKIDFKIRFVYYAMHGKTEVDEQLRQYCIQKEQPVFLDYLACFLNASDSEGCINSTGVDRTKLDACTAAADAQFDITKNYNDTASWLSGRFPLFNTDAELNEQYDIGGSPMLIINGAQSSAGRSPASYLAGICAAFNTPPAECDTELSTTTPGPGFGYDSTAAATAAGCGV